MNDCPRFAVRFGARCRFAPRYDKGAVQCPEGGMRFTDAPENVFEAFRPVTYVRDVCVTCGKTIERLP